MLLENTVCIWQMKTHLRPEQSGEAIIIILITDVSDRVWRVTRSSGEGHFKSKMYRGEG